MRQVLFYILIQRPFAWAEPDPQNGVVGFGLAWVILAVALAWLLVQMFLIPNTWTPEVRQTGIKLFGSLMTALIVGPWLSFQKIPVFGYGTMVLTGFLSGLGMSHVRARRIGLDPELLTDMSFWLLISGVGGGRLAYLGQYWREIYRNCTTVPQYLLATVNLTEGGLVLIGALVGGMLGFLMYCRVRKLSALMLVDVVMPGVFIGIGFGRIGCLLNGCCFGDACDWPWAIQFPRGSVPWTDLVIRKLLPEDAAWTMPLHPTQIYSSLDGFMLGTILWNLFPLRTRNGQLLAAACMMYATTRFSIEFLRNDEPGRFGTRFTISQWYSMGIFLIGLSLLLWLRKRGAAATVRLAPSEADAIG